MNTLLKLSHIFIFAILLISCTNSDNIEDDGDTDVVTEKPVITTFKFASSDIDCGAYTQSRIGTMIHINTEKCHNEVYRPTLTLDFGTANAISVGTFTIGKNSIPEAGSVYLSASDFMNPNLQPQIAWVATEGSIEISENSDDPLKVDVEFNSITMQNTSFAVTTDIPEFDTLTGFIIGI